MHFPSIHLDFVDIYPENYDSSQLPNPNHVISRDNQGNILSIYSDDIWDFTFYSTTARNYPLNFKSWHQGKPHPLTDIISNQMKQIIFSIIYLRPKESIQINTLRQKYISLRFFSKIAFQLGTNLRDGFKKNQLFFHACQNELKKQKKSYATSLVVLINEMFHISKQHPLFDFSFTANQIKHLVNLANRCIDTTVQTKVIPSRIYSQLFISFDLIFDNFFNFKDQILIFANKEHQFYTLSKQKNINNKIKAQLFYEYSTTSGLTEYFEKNKINSFGTFSSFLTSVHVLSKFAVLMYTGMRSSEAQILSYNSYSKIGEIYGFNGYTSKLAKTMKQEFWVSSVFINNAVICAQTIAKIAALRQNIDIVDEKLFPLFAASNRIAHSIHYKKYNIPHYQVRTFDSDDRFNIHLKRLCDIDLKVNSDDINEIIKLSNISNIEVEYKKNLGKEWSFHPHQFRRSLAVYSIKNTSASLHLLKKQFKHLYLQMTAYYAKNATFTEKFIPKIINNSFIKEFQEEEDFQTMLRLMNEVIKTDEHLWGAEGTRIENMKQKNKLPIIYIDEKEMLRAVKEGRLSHQYTFLGGCARPSGTCGKSEISQFSVCFNCTYAIFNNTTIKRLRALQDQLKFELLKHPSSSPEYLLTLDDFNSIEKLLENKIDILGI